MRPTAQQIADVLVYDPQTGVFTWRVDRSYKVKAGDVAGKINSSGHRQIRVRGSLYLAHQLVWVLMTGSWPVHRIDHVDNDHDHNAWHNLREATHSQNMWNRKTNANSSTGFKGVTLNKPSGKYIARVSRNGKRFSLGYFATAEEAYAARTNALTQFHGEFARSG